MARTVFADPHQTRLSRLDEGVAKIPELSQAVAVLSANHKHAQEDRDRMQGDISHLKVGQDDHGARLGMLDSKVTSVSGKVDGVAEAVGSMNEKLDGLIRSQSSRDGAFKTLGWLWRALFTVGGAVLGWLALFHARK